jgi:hypothetical protein
VDGDLDLQGTLGLSKEAPVGFQNIRIIFDVRAPQAHWRSDAEQALLLGEKVTISILRDQRPTYNEPFNGFTFIRFNGTTITV